MEFVAAKLVRQASLKVLAVRNQELVAKIKQEIKEVSREFGDLSVSLNVWEQKLSGSDTLYLIGKLEQAGYNVDVSTVEGEDGEIAPAAFNISWDNPTFQGD